MGLDFMRKAGTGLDIGGQPEIISLDFHPGKQNLSAELTRHSPGQVQVAGVFDSGADGGHARALQGILPSEEIRMR
jgi:hypothetical protein